MGLVGSLHSLRSLRRRLPCSLGFNMYLRFIAILLVAPVITAMISIFIAGEGALVVFAAYPLMLLASALLAPIVHLYIKQSQPRRNTQLLACALIGSVSAGLTAWAYLAQTFAQYPDDISIIKAASPYLLIGAAHASVAWILYTFGPLKISIGSPHDV